MCIDPQTAEILNGSCARDHCDDAFGPGLTNIDEMVGSDMQTKSEWQHVADTLLSLRFQYPFKDCCGLDRYQ